MWETVKTLRTVKNTLWVVIILLIAVFVLKWRSVVANRKSKSLSTQTNSIEVENYNAIVSIARGLNIRNEPNSEAHIIKTISNNSKIFVTDFNGPADTLDSESGNWYHIKYKSYEGWVWGNFVTVIGD